MQAEFFNGYNYLLDLENTQDITLKFNDLIVRLDNQEAQEQYRRKAETTLNLAQSDQPKDIAEFQWRITTPVATVLLALMAVPLARSAPRESRIRNVLIAVGIYIAPVYHDQRGAHRHRAGPARGTAGPVGRLRCWRWCCWWCWSAQPWMRRR